MLSSLSILHCFHNSQELNSKPAGSLELLLSLHVAESLALPSGPQTGRDAAAARRWPGVLREAEGASPGHRASRSAPQDETKPRCAPRARHPTDPPRGMTLNYLTRQS